MLSFSLGPLYANNREQPPFQVSHAVEKFMNTTVQVILKNHGGIYAIKLIAIVSLYLAVPTKSLSLHLIEEMFS